MQDNNINKIISNALQVNKDILSKNIKPIINQIQKALESNKEVIDLIEEIKKLQKEAVNLEYKNDDRYLEVDKLIKEKENILNNNKDYQEYLSKLKDFNNTLLASSSLIEDYVTDKVSI